MELSEYNFLLELYGVMDDYAMNLDFELQGYALTLRDLVESRLSEMVLETKKPKLTLVKD